MKKICLIIHSIGIGGMERVMHHIAVNFAKRENLEVHIVLIGINREIVYEIPKSIFVHKPNFEFKNSRRLFDTLRTMYFLRSQVKKINPDAVLSFGEIWNNFVLITLFGCNYPIFISDRMKPGNDLGKIHNFFRKKLYPKATGFIAQTETAKSICYSKKWNENACVIHNPIRQIETDDSIEKQNIILSVGRLVETKHFDHLIKIFSEIKRYDWKLVIVGGDANRKKISTDLQELMHKLKIEDSVFLEGEQRNIEEYYTKSKIFAFTSSSEGFPNVIGEAMSAGLPIIAYDCVAGPSDMINDGENGYLIPLFDTEAFKKKLELLMNDQELRNRLGKKAKEESQNYRVNIIADQFHDFIFQDKTSL